jgi:hypothetical protein
MSMTGDRPSRGRCYLSRLAEMSMLVLRVLYRVVELSSSSPVLTFCIGRSRHWSVRGTTAVGLSMRLAVSCRGPSRTGSLFHL